MELRGTGQTVQQGSQRPGGCVWPAAWGQGDFGAPAAPGVVADQRGLHANRFVARLTTHLSLAVATRPRRCNKMNSVWSLAYFLFAQ